MRSELTLWLKSTKLAPLKPAPMTRPAASTDADATQPDRSLTARIATQMAIAATASGVTGNVCRFP